MYFKSRKSNVCFSIMFEGDTNLLPVMIKLQVNSDIIVLSFYVSGDLLGQPDNTEFQ